MKTLFFALLERQRKLMGVVFLTLIYCLGIGASSLVWRLAGGSARARAPGCWVPAIGYDHNESEKQS